MHEFSDEFLNYQFLKTTENTERTYISGTLEIMKKPVNNPNVDNFLKIQYIREILKTALLTRIAEILSSQKLFRLT